MVESSLGSRWMIGLIIRGNNILLIPFAILMSGNRLGPILHGFPNDFLMIYPLVYQPWGIFFPFFAIVFRLELFNCELLRFYSHLEHIFALI